MVVFGINGCIRANRLYSGKIGFIRAKWVFLAKWLYLGKVVEFWQKCLYSGQSGCTRAMVVFGKSGCIRAKVIVFG